MNPSNQQNEEGITIMKILAHVFTYITTGFSALFHGVNKQCTSCERVSIKAPATFREFEQLCHDLRIKGAKTLYREYMEAYHEHVATGYDGLHPYDFFRQQNMLTV